MKPLSDKQLNVGSEDFDDMMIRTKDLAEHVKILKTKCLYLSIQPYPLRLELNNIIDEIFGDFEMEKEVENGRKNELL